MADNGFSTMDYPNYGPKLVPTIPRCCHERTCADNHPPKQAVSVGPVAGRTNFTAGRKSLAGNDIRQAPTAAGIVGPVKHASTNTNNATNCGKTPLRQPRTSFTGHDDGTLVQVKPSCHTMPYYSCTAQTIMPHDAIQMPMTAPIRQQSDRTQERRTRGNVAVSPFVEAAYEMRETGLEPARAISSLGPQGNSAVFVQCRLAGLGVSNLLFRKALGPDRH